TTRLVLPALPWDAGSGPSAGSDTRGTNRTGRGRSSARPPPPRNARVPRIGLRRPAGTARSESGPSPGGLHHWFTLYCAAPAHRGAVSPRDTTCTARERPVGAACGRWGNDYG